MRFINEKQDKSMNIKKLSRNDLTKCVANVISPSGDDLTSQQVNEQLLTFCLNCPDPVAAMNLIVDAPRGSTPSGLVDQALGMPSRDVATWTEAELSMDHPLRHWKLEG